MTLRTQHVTAREPESPAQPQALDAPTYCDLCTRKMDPDSDTLEASGWNICPICLEDMMYAHDQH